MGTGSGIAILYYRSYWAVYATPLQFITISNDISSSIFIYLTPPNPHIENKNTSRIHLLELQDKTTTVFLFLRTAFCSTKTHRPAVAWIIRLALTCPRKWRQRNFRGTTSSIRDLHHKKLSSNICEEPLPMGEGRPESVAILLPGFSLCLLHGCQALAQCRQVRLALCRLLGTLACAFCSNSLL